MIDKTATFTEVAKQVPSGGTLALGGMTNYRRPIAFTRALIRRFRETDEPKDITLLCFTAGLESDLLVGTGMVSRVRTCYFGLEIFGLAPMFTYYANRGLIEVIEETEASLALGLRASLAGIGFLPARAWIGTDLPELRPDVRTIIDPYTDETLIAFPAIKADVAVIHALKADREGNAIIGKNRGVDEELTLAAENIIITSEEIVPQLERADLIAPFTNSVVSAPQGALPTSCHPLYQIDGDALLDYVEKVSDPDTFEAYLKKLIKL